MTEHDYCVTDDPSDADIGELDDHINEFNFARTGVHDARFLSIMLRDDGGALYAGIHGYTWGGYCEIRLLWVADTRRGEGIGSALLETAEREARDRGCGHIMLTTHSFQAPEFYVRHGFRRVAAVRDTPRGHSHFTLVKKLVD